MRNWYRRWRLKRIIMALQLAVENHGLRPEILSVARALEATNVMTKGMKPDDWVALNMKKRELSTFISYMTQLHNSKLALLTRARIGLIALGASDDSVMPEGQTAMEFARDKFSTAKSSKDDKRIIQLSK